MSILVEILRSLARTLFAELPQLVSTFYGVLLGGLATLAVVRWQIREERRTREEREKEFLAVLVEHVNHEMTKNARTLAELIEACGKSQAARLEVWDWARTIVGSFSTEAHDDLYRTGLQRYLPASFDEEIKAGAATVLDIRNRLRQARAEHLFNAAYRDDGERINDELFAEVKAGLPAALERLRQADEVVDRRNLPWVGRELSQRQLRRRASWRRRVRRLWPWSREP